MRIVAVSLAVGGALTLQTTLARFAVGTGLPMDLVLIVVVIVGLTLGSGAGIVTGTVAGIVQDSLSGSIIGVGGFAKTVVGFLAGVLGSQFIVTQTVPRFLVLVGATLVHAACFAGLYAVLEPRGLGLSITATVVQALINGTLGVTALQLKEAWPGIMARRQARRRGRARRPQW